MSTTKHILKMVEETQKRHSALTELSSVADKLKRHTVGIEPLMGMLQETKRQQDLFDSCLEGEPFMRLSQETKRQQDLFGSCLEGEPFMGLSQETKRQQDLFGLSICDSVNRHGLEGEPFMRLSQETKRQQELFGLSIADSVNRERLGVEPLMGILQETKRQQDLFGLSIGDNANRHRLEGEPFMRLSQETKRQQDLFGSTIIDSVKRHHLGAEPLMGMLQETKRQADLFGIVGEPGLFKVTSLDSEVIKLSRIADATNKQAMRLGGQLGKFTDPFNTGNTDDPFGLSALVQKELDKEKEFARKELEEQQRRKECSYGRYEQFLCSARDLADKVHFKLSKVEKYSLTTSEFQDRWLTQLREWHCEIQDCLDIFWFDTPVIYYTQISERYTRTWRQLTMMSTKLLEIEVDIDHLLKAAS